MSKQLSYFIKKDGKHIPFRFYTKEYINPPRVQQYSLSDDWVKEQLCNRWRVLHWCGKKFVANKGTEEEVEATPNDVVVVANKFSWMRVWKLCLATFLMLGITWLIGSFIAQPPLTLSSCIKAMLFMLVVYHLFGLVAWMQSFEIIAEAKEWNDVKIPVDKLK